MYAFPSQVMEGASNNQVTENSTALQEGVETDILV